MKVAELFANDIHRHIEEIIKVDDLDDQRLLDEIREYHPTERIQEQLREVLEAYDSARQGPTQDIGIWISGFFGAGKSSFAKLLGVLLGNQKIGARNATEMFSERITNEQIQVFLRQIREHLPTHVVMFDVLKDRIAGAKEHPVTTVFYKALLRSLDYPLDLELAELEIGLESQGRLDAFRDKYEEIYDVLWRDDRKIIMEAPARASRVLHELDDETHPTADSWLQTRARVSLSPKLLAERVLELSERRAGGRTVTFIVDEMGRYISSSRDRIDDLNGVVESFAMYGQGKIWLAAVSQEKLDAILNIYATDKSELTWLKDRFPHKVFLSSSDIREVASHRVLRKKGEADEKLRELYDSHAGRLKKVTNVAGTGVEYPPLTEDGFVDLYPFLPAQIDLLIDIINGLRRHSGGQTELGAGNRKIIGLAQDLLIDDRINLADEDVGVLVTLDSVYQLMERDLPMELTAEVEEIDRQVSHPLASQVARALALLHFVEPVATTEESIAAVLHPSVDGDSVLPDVRDAVKTLLDARKIRRTERGLKIQSATERGWDEDRDSRTPTAGDRLRIIKSALEELWGKGAQAPQKQLGGWKRFTAGLRVSNETLVSGDIEFRIRVLDPGEDSDEAIQETRSETQQDGNDEMVAWTLEPSDEAERAVIEVFRSDHMLRRSAASAEEERLQREERRRAREAGGRLKAELEECLCAGRAFFRGNDRSPGDDAGRLRPEVQRILGPALEVIYHRFDEGDVRVSGSDVEAILTSENLAALPSSYSELGVVRTVDGQVRLITDEGAADAVLNWIRAESDRGRAPSGKELEHHFGSPPFGWSLDLLRLIVATLLRAGVLTLTAGAQKIQKAMSPEAKRELTNNTRFRGLTLHPRKSEVVDPKEVREAAQLLEKRFGEKVVAITPDSVASSVRSVLCSEIGDVEEALDTVRRLGLTGEETLYQALGALRRMRDEDDEAAIRALVESVEIVHKGLSRAKGIHSKVTPATEGLLEQARIARGGVAPVLRQRLEDAALPQDSIEKLESILSKETFFKELPALRTATSETLQVFGDLYEEAFQRRKDAYAAALEELEDTDGWAEIESAEQDSISRDLRARAEAEPLQEPWRDTGQLALIDEQIRAAPAMLEEAQRELRKLLTPDAVTITVRGIVPAEIRGEDDLEAALRSIREAVEKELAQKHPVILR